MKKHAEKNITDGMEKLIKKRTVIQKVMPQIFINSKNDMSMLAVKHSVGKGGRTMLSDEF